MTTPNPLPPPIPYHAYHGQHLDEPAIYDYVTDQAGVVMRVKTPHFYAVHRCAFGYIRGLKRWPEEGTLLSVPKIPAAWLARVLGHARRCGSAGRVAVPIEQMYHFHWQPVSSGPGFAPLGRGVWRVSIPKQRTTAARVTYRGGQEASVVLDLHSHHEMDAYFSPTDDRDEQGCRFYAVIGRIYGTAFGPHASDSRPEIRLRLGLYGEWLELPANALFEGLGPFTDAYQPETYEPYEEGVNYGP